jgi:imidazolonepropionase-like amidohydrolase
MTKKIFSTGVLLIVCLLPLAVVAQQNGKTYRYTNGHWFNGNDFEQKEMYVKNGVFTSPRNGKADSVIDLKGMYIVPPFAEAHTHLLEGIGDADARIKSYLRDGVFYVKNPNNVQEWTKTIYAKINNANSLDAVFANAGITAAGGHPESIYEDNIRMHLKGAMGEVERGWFKNKAYFAVGSAAELEAVWPIVLKGKPDFIKLYLSNTGHINQAGAKKLRTGLDPAIGELVVARARKAGLRTTAHVETAEDFRQALKIGVDEINHTPGFYLMSKDSIDKYLLTEADAKLAAKSKVFVVTALLSRDLLDDPALLPDAKKVQAANLSLLYKHGVSLAIGSDHATSPVHEIKALNELAIFDAKVTLKLWCESTPQTIFPRRKLGLLKEGYEANFLALQGNPLTDWSNTGKIVLRVKQGRFLSYL